MTGPESPTRRAFLLAAGTAALAGCSELGARSDDDGEIPPTRLPDVPDEGDSEPIVVDDVPVAIEREHLDEAAARAEALLGTVPIPLGPAEVPNGHVREELLTAADAATDRLDDARSAATRLSAMRSLRRARAEARYAAAGWAFVANGRTEAELRGERRGTARDAERFRSNHEYVGDDPVRAAVVHATVEGTIRRVVEDRGPSTGAAPGALLRVAEWGGHAESGRASLDDSRYLYDRFGASLPDDAASVAPTLEAAAESLTEDLRARRESLPPEPTASSGDPVDRLRYRLRRDAESHARNAPDGPPASTVVDATAALAARLAYDRLLDRIDDGERFRAESGADVRERRAAALASIRTALEGSPSPDLARKPLASAARLVTYGDDELARYRRSVRPARLDSPIRRYVTATLRARSVPAACERVLEALEG